MTKEPLLYLHSGALWFIPLSRNILSVLEESVRSIKHLTTWNLEYLIIIVAVIVITYYYILLFSRVREAVC